MSLLNVENLGDTRFLTIEEETKLFKLYQNVPEYQETITNILIKANRKLVYNIAKKYYPITDLTSDDIYQLGLIGMSKAIEKFDFARGIKFSTYATYWIKQSISRGMKKALEEIDQPIHTKLLKKQFIDLKKELENTLNRKVSFNEVANKMGFKASELAMILYMSNPIQLDSFIDDDKKITLQDTIPSQWLSPHEIVSVEEKKNLINNAINKLSEKEQIVIKMRYGFEDGAFHSFSEVALMMNISKQRVQFIEKQAIQKLRKILN